MKYQIPKRPKPFRDASLIIIATEDSNVDPKYFEDLAMKYRNSNIIVKVLRRNTTASSPRHIIDSLNEYKKNINLRTNDEMWLVCDVDKWGARLSEVISECIKKNYFYAVSNPCSDIWYLFHLKTSKEYSILKQNELFKNKKSGRRNAIEKEITTLGYSFNKSNLDTSQFLPRVEEAIKEAEKNDVDKSYRWPQHLGTRIYLLVRKIVK